MLVSSSLCWCCFGSCFCSTTVSRLLEYLSFLVLLTDGASPFLSQSSRTVVVGGFQSVFLVVHTRIVLSELLAMLDFGFLAVAVEGKS